MLVVDEPFPADHCVFHKTLVSSFEHWFDFLLVRFGLLPNLLKSHESIIDQSLEIDSSNLIGNQLSSLSYLILHIFLVLVQMLKPDFYITQPHFVDVDFPEMDSLCNYAISFSLEDVDQKQLCLALVLAIF